MKITVKEKEKKTPEKIDWKKLSRGTVVEFADGMRALVYAEYTSTEHEPALLLLGRVLPFEQAYGYLEKDVVKIVGTITEIIVEEN